MAIWSTLAAWLLVLVAVSMALVFSGTWPVVIDQARELIKAVGSPRTIALVLLVVSGLVVSTWSHSCRASTSA